MQEERFLSRLKAPLRCCPNGWADPSPGYYCWQLKGEAARARCKADSDRGAPYYTRCKPRALPLQQPTCVLPGGRSQCIANYACHSLMLSGDSKKAAGAAV